MDDCGGRVALAEVARSHLDAGKLDGTLSDLALDAAFRGGIGGTEQRNFVAFAAALMPQVLAGHFEEIKQ